MADPAPAPIPRRLPWPAAGEVGVWWLRAAGGAGDMRDAAQVARARGLVDAATLARADRMRREVDAARIVLSHALARRLVSAVIGGVPSELTIERRCEDCGARDHGRPLVPGGPSFSLSHAGDLVVVAVAAAEASVGVDAEALRAADAWADVRAHAFSDDEWHATASDRSGASRTAAWARKEAVVKATGHGVGFGLQRVLVAPPGSRATTHADAVAFAPGEPAAPSGSWISAAVPAPLPGHALAIALRDPGAPLRVTVREAALAD